MQKVTITGGSGFVGTNLCRKLSEQGIDFEILDLKPSRSFPDQCKIADIRDPAALRAAVTGDVIVHLAAVHRDDVRDLSEYNRTNVIGTENVMAVAEEKGIDRIVFTSSVAIYGFAPPGTDEDGAVKPFNEYGRTKHLAEEALRQWHVARPETRKLFIIRPTVIFGEGNRGNVYNLLRQINSGYFVMLGSGQNRKSLAYIENVVAFIHHVIDIDVTYAVANYVDTPDFDMNTLVAQVNEQVTGRKVQPWRLPFAAGLAIGYLMDGIAWITNRTFPISAVRVHKFCATTQFRAKTIESIGFKAPIPLEEGLRRTVEAEFLSPNPTIEVFYTE